MLDGDSVNRNVEIEKLIMRAENLNKRDIDWYGNLDKLNDDELFGLIKLSDEKDDKGFCLIMLAVVIMNEFNEGDILDDNLANLNDDEGYFIYD